MVQPPPYGQQPMPPQFGGWHDPYYGAMAPKPGCIPLRPLSVGEVLGGSFEAIKRNARTVFGLAAGIGVIQAIFGAVLQRWTSSGTRGLIDNSDSSAPTFHWGALGRVLGGSVGVAVLSGVFAAVLSGMLIVVVTEDVVGRRAGPGAVWRKVRSRLWRLVILSLVVEVVSAVGLLFCLAPGVWLWGIWAVAVPALIIENRGIGKALGRSFTLVQGMFWRVWGIRALGFVISFLISAVLSGIFTSVATAVTGVSVPSLFNSAGSVSLPVAYSIIVAIGSAVATTFTAPIQASVDSLLYVDLRMRKENLAVELQLAAAGSRPPQQYPPQQYPPQQYPPQQY